MDTSYNSLNIKVVRGHRATIAEVTLHVPVAKAANPYDEDYFEDKYEFDTVVATGESVRSPEDRDDPILGSNLAVARAVEALGRKLLKRAEGRMASNEHNQQHSAYAKANKEADELA
jgi:hypothetical protein